MIYHDSFSVAETLGVAENGIARMTTQGTLPTPQDHFISARGKRIDLWEEASLKEWFSALHSSQAAYVSMGVLGSAELALFGGYACPVRSGQIWARRPSLLAGYTKGSVTVWPVTGFTTDVAPFGARTTNRTNAPACSILDDVREHRGDDQLYSYFRLDVDNPLGSFTLDTIVRGGGGTVSPHSLHQAIQRGHAKGFKGGRAHWEQ